MCSNATERLLKSIQQAIRDQYRKELSKKRHESYIRRCNKNANNE